MELRGENGWIWVVGGVPDCMSWVGDVRCRARDAISEFYNFRRDLWMPIIEFRWRAPCADGRYCTAQIVSLHG